MMSRAPRWNDMPGSNKPNKPTQRKAGKDQADVPVPVLIGGKQGFCSKTSKDGVSHKGGGQHGHDSHQATRSARSALRLCSSHSFSSLHTPSLNTTPFIRSSRSLGRLDQRSTGDESDHVVRKIQSTGRKILHGSRRSTSLERMRDCNDRFPTEHTEAMKTSITPQQRESSSLVSTAASLHHKDIKQTRDGIYTLCAMTSGMKRNCVQALLKNARPGLSHEVQISPLEPNTEQRQKQPTSDPIVGLNSEQQAKESELSQSSPKEDTIASSFAASSQTSTDPQVLKDMHDHQCSQIVEVKETAKTEGLKTEREREQLWQKDDALVQTKDPLTLPNIASIYNKGEALSHEPHSAQLVKELEQTQRELSRLQQLNRNLQEELQQKKDNHSKEGCSPQNVNERALAFQQMQKINHELRSELEAQKSIQEEAREAELRRRVDLLAQQAQLLVTGDATALAQAHIEQDRRQFKEQQVEWERSTASLKSQLNITEEQRKKAESRFTQVQQELQVHQSLQKENEDLQKRLQELTTQFRNYEEGQAKKESQLQKHLILLQASQERERKKLATNLAKAEEHSKALQEQLDRVEQEIKSLHKSQKGTTEIEDVQQKLQQELDITVSALRQLQDERNHLDLHCKELQNHLSEAKREAENMQERLKTDEMHYYNLEHTYERVCEELQVVLKKLQQREMEMQEIKEEYEKHLDMKEQDLIEVLLKMEVLGNSLEETEVKLNEVLKDSSSHLKNSSSRRHTVMNDQQATESAPESMLKLHGNFNDLDNFHINGTDFHEHRRSRSRSVDSSHCIIPGGEDVDRFMSAIQSLETKLYITEEKLRDITKRLEEGQSHNFCQNPHRDTAQHLRLLLHSQSSHSQRFAQDTESLCRTLAGRYQVALNIALTCSEILQASPVNLSHLKRHLNTIVACLQQGEKDAERHQHESMNTRKEEWKRLQDEKLDASKTDFQPQTKLVDGELSQEAVESSQECLLKELFVVEKIVSALQNQQVAYQLTSMSTEVEGGPECQYKNITSQRMALKIEIEQGSEGEEWSSDKSSASLVSLVCAEAELIYAALKLQQQHESPGNHQSVEIQREGQLDINPPELVPYVEPELVEEDTTPVEKNLPDNQKLDAEKEPDWIERLTSRLQRRARFLHQIYQELSDNNQPTTVHRIDKCLKNMHFLQEQTKLVYVSNRLCLDLEDNFEQIRELESICKPDLMNEQMAFNHTLCQLQQSNTTLREQLHMAEKNILSLQSEKQGLVEDLKKIPDYHKEVEEDFQEKLKELQQLHEDEMKDLHSCFTKYLESKEKPRKSSTAESQPAEGSISQQNTTKESTEKVETRCNSEDMRGTYQKDQRRIQESCDQEVIAMEEIHRKTMEDLQHQHQKEVAEFQKEKEQLLKEETAATNAAIVAMQRARKQELQKSRRAQRVMESADITQLCIEYEKEIQLLHKELKTLSVQHSEKCVENTQLNPKLQGERESVMLYQQRNKQHEDKQNEMDEGPQPHFTRNGKQPQVLPQVDDFYEMEVILRAREAEMQFLKQEARALREELKIARMDKIYAQNKLKALCTNDQGDNQQHVKMHTEDSHFSTCMSSRDSLGQSIKDSATNVTLPKKSQKPSLLRQIRAVRSKSLKEGLTVQEKMKIFEC